MCGADALIDVAFHPAERVAGAICAQNIGIMGSGKLAAEFFHSNRSFGVAFRANEMRAFTKNRDVRVSRLRRLRRRVNEVAKGFHKQPSIGHGIDHERRKGVSGVYRNISTLFYRSIDI